MEHGEEVPLPIPAPLRAHMEDECFWILSRRKLLRLPRKPNVEDLLRQFYYHSIATPTDDTSPALLAEVLDGIKIYFDFMAEDHLLYGQEREQFKSVVTDRNKAASVRSLATANSQETRRNSVSSPTPHLEHTSDGNPRQPKSQLEPTATPNSGPPLLVPSQVYGAEHLLRLFLKFPLFLCRAQLPSAQLQLLHHFFKDLLTFLSSRRGELFSETNYDDRGTSGEGEAAKPETSPNGGEGGAQAPPTSTTPTPIS